MTDVKNSRLYKTLKKAVRRQDHAELLRMLGMIPRTSLRNTPSGKGLNASRLSFAFWWNQTPQDFDYWCTLSDRLRRSGHDCW